MDTTLFNQDRPKSNVVWSNNDNEVIAAVDGHLVYFVVYFFDQFSRAALYYFDLYDAVDFGAETINEHNDTNYYDGQIFYTLDERIAFSRLMLDTFGINKITQGREEYSLEELRERIKTLFVYDQKLV